MTTQNRTRIIGATTVGVIGNAVLGSAATDTTSWWYRTLRKPAFQPPGWVFPVAWTALYADMAAVVGQSLAELHEQGDHAEYEDLKKALAANVALNAGWSLLFFRGQRPGLATIEAAALAASSADLTRRCLAVNPRRGAWLAPYAAWTAFATVLTGTIWYLNR
ncbi:TspO/MBR family protein [Corynebacterium sp.]|uniref:TspO/MBR family protein n=1 Tax=Corynebacterium sp. TaxID=1720 RepID=UPI0026DEC1BB|nr:TspO/MBR family protein [Corynebacterium sp.]MDO5512072.1 TspO/MBR family protein [Corynebacterium sp.]